MSIYSHQSMTNHHGPGFWPRSRKPFTSGASAGASAANWRSGPSATCTMSACPGATSPTRPKSRFGGHEASTPGRRRLCEGRRPSTSCAPTGACHDRASPRRPPAIFRHPAAARRPVADGALCRARDAEALQAYFRSLSVRSRYNRFLGAMSELPPDPARPFHPCRRGRPLQRDRDHEDRRLRDHRRRSPLRVRCRCREFRVRPVGRRPLAGPGHRLGAARKSGMPRRRVRRRAPVRRYAALQRGHDRRWPANPASPSRANPGDWKLVRFEKHIDVAPQEIPCASWRLAARQIAHQAAV